MPSLQKQTQQLYRSYHEIGKSWRPRCAHPPLVSLLLLLLFSLCCSIVSQTDAIRIAKPYTFTLHKLGNFSFSDSIYLPSAQSVSLFPGGFGFEHGGKLSLNVTLSGINAQDLADATLIFTVLDSEAYRYMKSSRYDASLARLPDLCQQPSLLRHQILFTPQGMSDTTHDSNGVMQAQLILDNFNVLYTSRYELVVMRCEAHEQLPEVHLTLHSLEMTNPSTLHLSLEQQPMIVLYPALAVIFAVFALVSLVGSLFEACGCTTTKQLLSRVHWIFVFALAVRVAWYIVGFFHYSYLRQNGFASMGTMVSKDLLSFCSDCAYLIVLLLFALGLSITRYSLTKREIIFMLIGFGLFATSGVLNYSVCDGAEDAMSGKAQGVLEWWPSIDAIPRACAVFGLSHKIIRLFIYFSIVVNINATIERLRALAQDQQVLPRKAIDVVVKLDLYKNFRLCFIVILILPLMAVMMEYVVLSWQQAWVVLVFSEFTSLAMFVAIAWLFGPYDPVVRYGSIVAAKNAKNMAKSRVRRARRILSEQQSSDTTHRRRPNQVRSSSPDFDDAELVIMSD